MSRQYSWTITSAVTSLVVVGLTALAVSYPDRSWTWGLCALGGVVFAVMLARNPVYRYWRLAWWLTAAWVTANVVPEVSAWLRIGEHAEGGFAAKNSPGAWFHIAWVVGLGVPSLNRSVNTFI